MTGEDYEARKDEHRPDWPGYMTDHLQGSDAEPWESDGQARHLPECVVIAGDGMCGICQEDRCICDRLRACEQRVLLSKPNIELSAVYGYEAGRSDGLNAAREAVAAVPSITLNSLRCDGSTPSYDVVKVTDALAAIDALRGES